MIPTCADFPGLHKEHVGIAGHVGCPEDRGHLVLPGRHLVVLHGHGATHLAPNSGSKHFKKKSAISCNIMQYFFVCTMSTIFIDIIILVYFGSSKVNLMKHTEKDGRIPIPLLTR